ncbi:MAG: hypothetical protein IPK83_00995 [Planctomycetes bacterium]|nr:hypothetical protein [Planctomycetota bacterium]
MPEEGLYSYTRILALLLLAAQFFANHASADDRLFILQANRIALLTDLNADGDYLDFAEIVTYAEGLPQNVDSIAFNQGRLFAAINQPPGILVIEDLNHDGDALDFAEVRTFATYQPLAHSLKDIVVLPDGTVICGNETAGQIIQFRDDNGDGDALDFDEITVIASIDGTIRAISARPDGCLLVAIATESTPVRILRDRNLDGDYFDFAENLSYAENLPAGVDLQSPHNNMGYLSRLGQSDIMRLFDRTRRRRARFRRMHRLRIGIDGISALAHRGDVIYAAVMAQTTRLLVIRDSNDDGDALDFGEVLEAAAGLEPIKSMAVPTSNIECLLGDTNADGLVTPADIPSMASAIVGVSSNVESCQTDMNGDGQLDGRDISLFVAALLN